MFLWTGVSEKLIPLKLGDFNHECSLKDYLKIADPILPKDEARQFIPSDRNVINLSGLEEFEFKTV